MRSWAILHLSRDFLSHLPTHPPPDEQYNGEAILYGKFIDRRSPSDTNAFKNLLGAQNSRFRSAARSVTQSFGGASTVF